MKIKNIGMMVRILSKTGSCPIATGGAKRKFYPYVSPNEVDDFLAYCKSMEAKIHGMIMAPLSFFLGLCFLVVSLKIEIIEIQEWVASSVFFIGLFSFIYYGARAFREQGRFYPDDQKDLVRKSMKEKGKEFKKRFGSKASKALRADYSRMSYSVTPLAIWDANPVAYKGLVNQARIVLSSSASKKSEAEYVFAEMWDLADHFYLTPVYGEIYDAAKN